MPLHPHPSLAEARQTHGKNGRWNNFALRILRHPEIRQEVWQRQQGQCFLCHKPLKLSRISIHHLSYEHFCVTNQSGPVQGQRGRCPPCHNCNSAAACLERLTALCRRCHRQLHRIKLQK